MSPIFLIRRDSIRGRQTCFRFLTDEGVPTVVPSRVKVYYDHLGVTSCMTSVLGVSYRRVASNRKSPSLVLVQYVM